MIARFLWRLWYAITPEPAGLTPLDAARYTATKHLRTTMTTQEIVDQFTALVGTLQTKLVAKEQASAELTLAEEAVTVAEAALTTAQAAETTAGSAYAAADAEHDAAAQQIIDFAETLKAA